MDQLKNDPKTFFATYKTCCLNYKRLQTKEKPTKKGENKDQFTRSLEIQEEIFVIDIFCFHLVSDVLC
jgi:hypothetical protein